MLPPDLLHVFVYGTLKPGEHFYPRYCEGKVVASVEAIALGTLYDLPMGYPALTPGENPVYGYVLSFADFGVLAALDELEGYDPHGSPLLNEYERSLTTVYSLNHEVLGQAWHYWMTTRQAEQLGGTRLAHGRWTGRNLSQEVSQ